MRGFGDETTDQHWTRPSLAESPAVPGLIIVFSGDTPLLQALALREREPALIGRGLVGTIELDDRCMSRRHVEVAREGEAWRIRDLGSRNGTAIDGVALHGELTGESARVLRAGDTLILLSPDVRPFLHARIAVEDGVVIGPTLRAAWDRVDAAARSGGTVHLIGASGSGKELAAARFHAASAAAKGPFVAVNCATIPEALAERLLFGAKKGAFSGADADTEGYIQEADRGTLFLDEVAELSLAVQAKLLRVLETKEAQPLGAARARKVAVQICSATHEDLRSRVSAGRFREDLYFRLARPSVAIPALRDRLEDIPRLIAGELARAMPPARAHVSLVEACLTRPWPGNVRELFKELRAAVEESAGEPVEARHLAASAGVGFVAAATAGRTKPAKAKKKAARPLAEDGLTREAIAAALDAEGGNVSRAAKSLGVHRTHLRRRIARFDIDPAAYVPKDD